jgi:hypothetical protein
MNRTIGLSALVAATAITSVSSATILIFDQRTLWENYVASQGSFVFDENFNDIADGTYASPFAGTAGPVNWSAVAPGGIEVSGGVFSTVNPVPLGFQLSNVAVGGVGGNFFGTDGSFTVVPALLFISLSDGTSYAGVVSNANSFTGFYSTGPSIVSITIQAISTTTTVYATVDNMTFAAVPAPGVAALIGLAGAVAGRRRRR